jgi:PAS domain S-box-containing protein
MGQPMRSTVRAQPSQASTFGPSGVVAELFDAALDAVVLMDRSGQVAAWNRRAEETFGWTVDEVVGRRLSEVIIPKEQRLLHERGLRRTNNGKPHLLGQRLRLSALHRDGHEFPIELTIIALGAGAGRTYAGFVRDLTREEAAEAARSEAEVRYRSLVERLPGIAYVNEIGGETRFVSPRVEAMLGYRPEEWSFDLWRDRLHSRDRAGVLGALAAGEQSDEPFTLTYRIRARDGRWLRIRDEAIVVKEPEGGRSVHGVMFDVTRERTTELELRASFRERQQVVQSLHRLQAAASPEETATAICTEVARIRHVDMVSVLVFEPDGSVVPIAGRLPLDAPVTVGHPLPVARAAYLRESATGPWIDEWTPGRADDDYTRRWLEMGLACSAYVPFGAGGKVYGLLAAGTQARVGVDAVTRWLPSLAEYAAVAGALLIPALTGRRATADLASPIRRAIDERAFVPHFQPVVELESRSVVGYEALTRFDDGTPPERRFADADQAGLGQELELACLRAAMDAGRRLPAGRWLSLNVSTWLLSNLSDPGLLAEHGRPLILELTERLEIRDYETVREDLRRIPEPVSVAVDDAGAGFASLRHIIELHPRYVKIDLRLIRGLDSDPARQAMIAGMVYFSRQTDCALIAEGIETEGERRALRQLGVTFGQGYLFGAPAPVDELPDVAG